LTVALTPLVIRLARRVGWVARPTEDRWHERPTALMGGLAIWAGALVGWALAPAGGWPWALAGGGTLLFLLGVADDLNGLSPVAKVLAQVAGATVLLVAGWELAPAWPFWLSAALTYLWVIGITNAVNLLDNMDGLAAGIAGIAAATVAVLAGVEGSWPQAGPALAVVGAAAGFLVYNHPPARIFMGDGGSLFLGFAVAALAMGQPGAGASGTAAVLAVPAALMAVPILDTTLVTLKRIAGGRPVTQGGQDHSSHRLVFLGLSERRAVWTLYGVAAGFSALAVAFQLFSVYLTLAVAALAAVALAVFGVFLGEVRVARSGGDVPASERNVSVAGKRVAHTDTADGRRGERDGKERVVLRAALRNKREIAGLLADLLLIVGSFVVAHYLRFEEGLPQSHLDRMVTILPVVVLVKIGALYAFGAYQDLLRYAGSSELIRVAKASTLASGLLVVGLVVAFRFEGFSRSVFIIDWLLATFALVAVRGAFRGLRGYFATRRQGGRRVLLYGAGDAGYLALREIRQNPALDLEPVGFVDDDRDKQGRTAHGLRVLGGGDELGELCRRRQVSQVIVAISDLPDASRRRIRRRCREVGVEYSEMRVGFVAPDDGNGLDDGSRTGMSPEAAAEPRLEPSDG
jgi:UDP-GlcNAc:undecaprenyl-phosphate GlcNAc-1-phosphate transferase